MRENELLEAENLGIQFEYPQDYKDFLKDMDKIENTSWWLIGTTKDMFEKSYKVINVDYESTKLLIPFAKSDQSNILACFDSSHRVWLTSCENNDITGADWESRFSLPNFTAWLKAVLSNDIV